MDPEWMKEVDDKYGPLEWHLPESHAIYWAYLALEKTDKKKLKKDDLITCRRVIFQSLQLAFRRGRLVYPDKSKDEFIYAPNLDIVPQANSAYLEMIGLEQQDFLKKNIANAHKNFLKWAVYYLYLYGRTAQADYWWKQMHQFYPDATPPGQDMRAFALERAKETVGETGHDDAKAMIEGLLTQGFYYLATEDDPQASDNLFNFAASLRARFQAELGPKSLPRVHLPELGQMKQEVLNRLLAMDPTLAALLRSKLGLPAGTEAISSPPSGATPSTNAPTANAAPAPK
jgi:hypothetical protein